MIYRDEQVPETIPQPTAQDAKRDHHEEASEQNKRPKTEATNDVVENPNLARMREILASFQAPGWFIS